MNEQTNDKWLYFGSHGKPGQFLWEPGMKWVWIRRYEQLLQFDGILPPQDDPTGYVATISRLGGWGVTALAFWDYTIDKRARCNSVFYAPSLTISVEDLFAGAKQQFPEVWARLPEVKLHPSSVPA